MSGLYVPFYISVVVLLFLTIFFSTLGEALAEGKSRNIERYILPTHLEVICLMEDNEI